MRASALLALAFALVLAGAAFALLLGPSGVLIAGLLGAAFAMTVFIGGPRNRGG